MKLKINNEEKEILVRPAMRLIDLLREELRLTGTKEGCGEGECGACSIILNGKAVNSCIILVGQLCDGDHIETVEGLAKDGKLNALQDSFIRNGAVHCGACIPGMLMSATALLRETPKPTDEDIKSALAGNLCRCTGYEKILRAVKDVI